MFCEFRVAKNRGIFEWQNLRTKTVNALQEFQSELSETGWLAGWLAGWTGWVMCTMKKKTSPSLSA